MTVKGLIKFGKIELPYPVQLPDGTMVEVEVRPLPQAFWQDQTLDQLAKAQGVVAVSDTSALTGDWPADDDVDEFLNTTREARQ